MVNALWAGGAEAMQIMDQRVIATSAVRCVGNTLILQGRVYSPPYDDHRHRRPRAAGAGARRLRRRSQLYRYYVDTFGLVYETQRRDQDPAARLRRLAGPAARPGHRRDRAPAVRGARRAAHHRRPGAAAVRGLPAGVDQRRGGPRAPTPVADDVRDAWERPPTHDDRQYPGGPAEDGQGLRVPAHPAARAGLVGARSSRASPADLARASGTTRGTALPGEVGNFAVAGSPGHQRRAVRAPRPGAHGRRRRRRDPRRAGSPTSSTGPRSSSPTSVWVLDPVPGKPGATPTAPLLTLTTCNPRWASTERLIVFGHLTETRPEADGPPAALVRTGGRA